MMQHSISEFVIVILLVLVYLFLPHYLLAHSKRSNKAPYRKGLRWSLRLAIISYLLIALLDTAVHNPTTRMYLRDLTMIPLFFLILPFVITILYFLKERPPTIT